MRKIKLPNTSVHHRTHTITKFRTYCTEKKNELLFFKYINHVFYATGSDNYPRAGGGYITRIK